MSERLLPLSLLHSGRVMGSSASRLTRPRFLWRCIADESHLTWVRLQQSHGSPRGCNRWEPVWGRPKFIVDRWSGSSARKGCNPAKLAAGVKVGERSSACTNGSKCSSLALQRAA